MLPDKRDLFIVILNKNCLLNCVLPLIFMKMSPHITECKGLYNLHQTAPRSSVRFLMVSVQPRVCCAVDIPAHKQVLFTTTVP